MDKKINVAKVSIFGSCVLDFKDTVLAKIYKYPHNFTVVLIRYLFKVFTLTQKVTNQIQQKENWKRIIVLPMHWLI